MFSFTYVQMTNCNNILPYIYYNFFKLNFAISYLFQSLHFSLKAFKACLLNIYCVARYLRIYIYLYFYQTNFIVDNYLNKDVSTSLPYSKLPSMRHYQYSIHLRPSNPE